MGMKNVDHLDLKEFLVDPDLIETLNVDVPASELASYYCTDGILRLDGTVRVPFFAEIHDYSGAEETANPAAKWIVKKAGPDELRRLEMAAICFLTDHLARTLSVPSIITMIEGEFYKATKMISRFEPLSETNYSENGDLKEQLALDLVNRWIYFDENRIPRNYMIRHNSRDYRIVIPTDFLGVDLVSEGMKIEGLRERFGWSDPEQNRRLSPLKEECYLAYDLSFFEARFERFGNIDGKVLEGICDLVLRHDPERKVLAKRIASNLKKRAEYVHGYFREKLSR